LCHRARGRSDDGDQRATGGRGGQRGAGTQGARQACSRVPPRLRQMDTPHPRTAAVRGYRGVWKSSMRLCSPASPGLVHGAYARLGLAVAAGNTADVVRGSKKQSRRPRAAARNRAGAARDRR
jgi:hypothetical protein